MLEPVTRAAVQAIIADALGMGITLQVTESFRSRARQQMMFAQKLTQLKECGVHLYGCAADVMRIEEGKADWTVADYYFLGPLAAKHGLVWGGTWTQQNDPTAIHTPGFHDWDHLQRVTIAEQPALFAGTFYPSDSAD